MNRLLKLSLPAVCLVGLLVLPLAAQVGGGGNGPGGPGPNERPFRGNRGGGDGDGGGGGRGGRGGNFDPNAEGRGPRGGPTMQQYEMLRSYIEVVDRFSKLAQDPQAAGVAAVVSASDLLRQRGPQEAISYFTKVLPDVKDPAVRRAIRIQLVDLYKQSNETDKALEQLDALMKNTTAQGAPTTSPSRP